MQDRDTMILANIGLVRGIVARLWKAGRHVRRIGEFSDVVSVGVLALFEAWAAYCRLPCRRAAFGTYAYPYVRGRILREAKSSGVIRTPMNGSPKFQEEVERAREVGQLPKGL